LWALHLATVQGGWEQSVMYLPWPLTLGVVWAAGRRWLIPETSFLPEREFPK
jgi:hypothetical protein